MLSIYNVIMHARYQNSSDGTFSHLGKINYRRIQNFKRERKKTYDYIYSNGQFFGFDALYQLNATNEHWLKIKY